MGHKLDGQEGGPARPPSAQQPCPCFYDTGNPNDDTQKIKRCPEVDPHVLKWPSRCLQVDLFGKLCIGGLKYGKQQPCNAVEFEKGLMR
eukprot:1161602-Pelagomonas_calceolata.AAC.3